MNFVTVALIMLGELLSTTKASTLPHLIMFLGDDMGWGNAGWHNNNSITPFMDNLIQTEGIELDRHYVFFYCSPTRTSIMSGRLPLHVAESNSYPCNYNGSAPLEMTFLPAKLQTAGYRTHHIGKWHIGGFGTAKALPINKGFDTSFGYLYGAEDHYTNKNGGCSNAGCGAHVDLWRDRSPAYGENSTKYSARLYASEAERVIRNHNQSTPMFMYLAIQDAHGPDEPDFYGELYSPSLYTNDFISYNGMMSAADDVARNLTSVLKEVGMWDNTLMIFSSDNGGPTKAINGNANNYPLRGGKCTSFEGGHRAIAFATGGLIPETMKGAKLEGYIHIADWYTTFCRLAGVDHHDHPAVSSGWPDVDGIDMWDYITGSVTTSPRTELPLSSMYAQTMAPPTPRNNTSSALIVGDYKLIRYSNPYCNWFGPTYPNASSTKEVDPCTCPPPGCLFNIKTDPGEHVDLCKSPDHQQILQSLVARAEELDLTAIEHGRVPGWRGYLNQTESCKQMVQNGGYWGPYDP